MSDVNLPEGWIQRIAADCFDQISTNGIKVKTKDCQASGLYPVIDQGQEFISGYIDDSDKLIELEKPVIVFGDHTRNIKWVDFVFVPGADGTKLLLPHEYLHPRIAFYELNNLEIPDKGYSRHFKFLKELEFPIPPLAEQKVIADKLDTLLAQVETTKARLDRIPKILKTFRQSVLAAAVSGKLTEEWRGKNGSLNVDLGQIAKQHKAYFTEEKRKYNEPTEFKANNSTPKVPDNWRWFRAEQLCDLITKGTTPKKEHMTKSGDIPYIKVYNLTFDGSLDFSIEPTFIPKLVHDNELKRSKVFPGDVLMNIVGPPLGKVSIVPESHRAWNINQAISIFRPVSGVTNEYLSICLRDEFLLELTKSKAKATVGQFNLTLEICRDYSIPVPPLEEQTEIVRRVEELFAFADSIEQKTNAALERVNNLTQSILAKAFRGELTADWRAQNPELISGDNSAEALLERIKAERAAALASKKKPIKKTRAKKKV
ncbi:restriction endonuclease subunit S [Gammaproteobacteria bacterium AS21]